MISRYDYHYFQPEGYSDDGTNIEYGGVPEPMYSFQAFRTQDECKRWLINNGYEPGDFVIHEYSNDDIEGMTLIDEWGDVIDRIEERTDEEIADRIVDDVIWNAGSEDNLHVVKQDDETRDHFMDRVYTWANDLIMDAIINIENDGDYNFQSYAENPDIDWYDEARIKAIQKVIEIMLEETEYSDCY